MKRIFVIALLIALAGAIGYLVGTEDGRRYRDQLVARVRKETAAPAGAAEAATTAARDAASDAAEQLSA